MPSVSVVDVIPLNCCRKVDDLLFSLPPLFCHEPDSRQEESGLYKESGVIPAVSLPASLGDLPHKKLSPHKRGYMDQTCPPPILQSLPQLCTQIVSRLPLWGHNRESSERCKSTRIDDGQEVTKRVAVSV